MARPLSLAEALKALAASEPEARDHPPLSVLVAYQEGRLPEEEAETVREHLVACDECSEQVLDLAAFEEASPPLGDHPLSEGDVAAAWEKLKKRLPDGPPPARVLSFARLPRYVLPLAACLALSVTAAVWWVAHSREVARRNPDSLYLALDQSGTRGPEGSVTRSASRALDIYAQGIEPYITRVRIEIRRDLDGRVVKSGKEQKRVGDTVKLYTVPAKELEPGAYRVVIYGDDQEDPLDTFGLILN